MEWGKRIGILKKRLNIPGIAYGTILMILFFSVIAPEKFLSLNNIMLILRHSCILLIASMGMTLVILVSQVDLSIGSVMSLAAVVVSVSYQSGMGLLAAVALSLLAGLATGLVNGIMVAVFRFDYWITTFATMSIGAGLALVLANGSTVVLTNPVLDWFGNGKIGGIYVVIILTVLMFLIMQVILNHTKLGYNLYSIGGSENVARVSGINVTKYRVIPYLLSGVFAATAGIMITAMNNSASPIIGSEYSFNAMAAVIIGGTSLDGGKGGLAGTVFGTLLLRILTSGLNIMSIPPTWQKTIIGAVIVIIIVADVMGQNYKKTKGLRRVYADA